MRSAADGRAAVNRSTRLLSLGTTLSDGNDSAVATIFPTDEASVLCEARTEPGSLCHRSSQPVELESRMSSTSKGHSSSVNTAPRYGSTAERDDCDRGEAGKRRLCILIHEPVRHSGGRSSDRASHRSVELKTVNCSCGTSALHNVMSLHSGQHQQQRAVGDRNSWPELLCRLPQQGQVFRRDAAIDLQSPFTSCIREYQVLGSICKLSKVTGWERPGRVVLKWEMVETYGRMTLNLFYTHRTHRPGKLHRWRT